MGVAPELRTERLRLRGWRDDDLAPFAALNADARVMAFMPKLLSREESDAFVTRIENGFRARGFGLWAVEVKHGPSFVGYVGLSAPAFRTRFTPCVEVGWRLALDHWGKGFATEAARSVLRFGFEVIGLHEIVSFTPEGNQRSRRVMERIGMNYSPNEDFEHPLLHYKHPLCKHVLYRKRRT